MPPKGKHKKSRPGKAKTMRLVREALRREGRLFPTTDAEVKRFVEERHPEPPSPELIKRATAHALSKRRTE